MKQASPSQTESPSSKVALSVSEDLRIRIDRCELMPGERLKFKDLRDHYEVSIGALREELTILEVEGLVLCERNKGYQVSSVSVGELTDLTDLRILLERRALSQSVDAGDDAWESRVVSAGHMLRRIEEERSDAIVLDPLWAQRHRDFHMALISACPSEWTLRYCKQLMQFMHRYLCLSVRLRGGRAGRSFDDHGSLIELALARDADRACDVLERHLRSTTDAILKALPELGKS